MNFDRFAELLLDYDDRLRSGRGDTAATPCCTDCAAKELDDDLRRRFEGAAECLRRLERARLAGHAAFGVAQRPATLDGRIGRFELIRELGRGGHGIVFLAWDPAARREVAVKIPRPEVLLTAEDRRRFLREGIAAARLSHPNIVPVLEVDQSPPNCYIVSAYCEGQSLAVYLAEVPEPLAPALAAHWVAALADGVAHAHDHGILHRDLKPANVVLEQPPRGLADSGDQPPMDIAAEEKPLVPKLTDFGLAKLLDSRETRTRTGVMLGTPNYMAPEQVDQSAGKVGPATDVYGLGAILYELLARRPPFEAENLSDVLRQVAEGDPQAPSQFRRDLPRDLEAICLRCLQRRPQHRYPTAAALAVDLRRYLAGEVTRARPLGPVRRTIKWIRRKPALAAALAVSVIASLVLMGGAAWHFVQLGDALVVTGRARVRAETSESELRHLLYLRDVQSAHEALQRHDVRIASNLLKRRGTASSSRSAGFLLRHLWAVCTGQPRAWKAHRGRAHSVEFTPDGKSLISAGSDGAVNLWDFETAALGRTLQGHTGDVNVARSSPDGKTIASCGDDGLVRLWDADNGNALGVLTSPELKEISCVAWSPDGLWLAAGGTPGSAVLLWEIGSRQVKARFVGHTDEVNFLAWSPDGKLLATASSDHTVRVWDRSGREQAVVEPELTHVNCVVFSADGKALAAAGMQDGNRGVVKVLDRETWQLVATYDTRADRVDAIAAAPHDDVLAIGDNFGAVHEWNWRLNRVLRVVDSQHGRISSLAYSPTAAVCAAAAADGSICVWNHTQDTSVAKWSTSGLGAGAAFTPDSRQLILATAGSTEVVAYNLRDRSVSVILRRHHGDDYLNCAVSSSRRGFVTTRERFVYRWDLNEPAALRLLFRSTSRTNYLTITPDGKHLVAGEISGQLRLRDSETGELQSILGTVRGGVNCLACLPSGELAASGSAETTIRLWDLKLGKSTRVFDHGSEVVRIAFSRDGRTLASAGRDRLVRFWDLATGAPQPFALNHSALIGGLAFCPDEPLLASADSDGFVRLWSLVTGEELLVLGRLGGAVEFLAFSPDGCWLAAATNGSYPPQETRFWHAPASYSKE